MSEDNKTPNGVRIYAQDEQGHTTNITEGVQALYDGVIGSMDWGSGFWTVEDAIPVARVAEICGFEGAEATSRYLRDKRRDDLREKLRKEGMPFQECVDAAKRAFPDPEK